MLAVYDKYGDRDQLLRAAAENQFYNTSPLTLARVLADPPNVADQLSAYIAAFSRSQTGFRPTAVAAVRRCREGR